MLVDAFDPANGFRRDHASSAFWCAVFRFHASGATVTARTVFAETAPKKSPNEVIRVGIMGVNNRGAALAKGFIKDPGSDVVAICDVDSRASDKVANSVADTQGHRP